MALVASLAAWTNPDTSSFAQWTAQEVNKAAVLVREYLNPRDLNNSTDRSRPDLRDLQSAVRVLTENSRLDEVYQDYLDAVENRIHLVRNDLARLFNGIQSNAALSVSPETDRLMAEFLERMAKWQGAWCTPVRALQEDRYNSHCVTNFQTHLYASLPAAFSDQLRTFLAHSLAALPSHLREPPHDPPEKGPLISRYEEIKAPSSQLGRLSIVPRYAMTINQVAFAEIDRIAQEEAAKGWDTRRLIRARQRVGDGVANWLHSVSGAAQIDRMRQMFSRFDYYLCKRFFDIRTDELFDIIVDYPDSLPALEDLEECLYKVSQRDVLVEKLRAANVKRLLHPGAETKDVIAQYISTIRCLRILDPPGVLLHKVADPIRRHLKERPDTVKCVVATLVEGEELQDENEAGGLIQASHDEAVENFLDPSWEPEPFDAAPQFRSGKASDIISTLVSIYDTKEVIIKELQVLLAQRLLAVKDYDAVKEIRTIELLKLRFGEATLQVCEVMLKDMADSKRIDDRVQGDAKVKPAADSPHECGADILEVCRASIGDLADVLAKYTFILIASHTKARERQYETAFHHFKPDKRLRWLQHMGTATVRLELEDRIVEVEATPLQASISELFENQAVWEVPAMSEKLGVDVAQIRNGLAFWANEGVVKEEKGHWRLLEFAEEGAVTTTFVEETPIIDSANQGNPDNVRVYWQFIKGMLTSLGPKTIDEIQRNLESFADDYSQTQEELGAFMQAVRQEGLVDQKGDGKWILLQDK